MVEPIPPHDVDRRGRHAAIAIPKGSSVSMTADAPSFLTTLPAELRIEVYQWLFRRDDPIIFTGRLPDRVHDFLGPSCLDNGDDEEVTQSQNIPSAVDLEIMRQPTHDIGPGIRMLHACRQIYHEAVGILYSSNSFTISVDLYRHNRIMEQFNIAALFMRNLGSQSSLLRRVNIDIDPSCPYGQIDILPIVRILWSGNMKKCEFALVNTGRRLDSRLPHPDLGVRKPGPLDAGELDQILKAIGTGDALNLARYGRFARLLNHIWIRNQITSGLVVYGGSSLSRAGDQGEGQTFTNFFISFFNEQGERRGPGFTPFRKRLRYVLDNLPLSCRERVRKFVTIAKNEVVFDLDQRKAHGLDFKLLHANKEIRNYMQQHHGSLNQVVIRMSTTQSKTDFSGWSSLDHWCQQSISKLYPRYDRCAVTTGIIALVSMLTTKIAHSELRINVLNFIRLTYGLNSFSTVRFVVAYKFNGIEQESERNILLQDLRKHCFLLLSLVIERHPNRAAKDCPELWIDGEGNAIEAVYPASGTACKETITNPHMSLEKEEQQTLGLQYASSLYVRTRPKRLDGLSLLGIGNRPLLRQNKVLNEHCSLRRMWKTLRGYDWPELKTTMFSDNLSDMMMCN